MSLYIFDECTGFHPMYFGNTQCENLFNDISRSNSKQFHSVYLEMHTVSFQVFGEDTQFLSVGEFSKGNHINPRTIFFCNSLLLCTTGPKFHCKKKFFFCSSLAKKLLLVFGKYDE